MSDFLDHDSNNMDTDSHDDVLSKEIERRFSFLTLAVSKLREQLENVEFNIIRRIIAAETKAESDVNKLKKTIIDTVVKVVIICSILTLSGLFVTLLLKLLL